MAIPPDSGPWTKYQKPAPGGVGPVGPWTQYAPTKAPAGNLMQMVANLGKGFASGLFLQPFEAADRSKLGNAINSLVPGSQQRQAKFDQLVQKAQPRGAAGAVGEFTGAAIPFLAAPEIGAEEAPLLARAAIGGMQGAGLTAAQGGSAKLGAAMGAAGPLIHAAGEAMAPAIMNRALGTRAVNMAGKNPGLGALQDARGIRAATIARTGNASASGINAGIRQMAADISGRESPSLEAQMLPGFADWIGRPLSDSETASMQPKPLHPVSLSPARSGIAKAIASTPANAPTQRAAFQSVMDNLGVYPSDITPSQAIEAKQGLESEFINRNVEPTLIRSAAAPMAKQAKGAINTEMERVMGPEFSAANQRMANVIEAARLADRSSRQGSPLMRVAGDVGRHATAPGLGALLGYEFGGRRGAAAGALGGLAFTPEGLALQARLAYGDTLPRVVWPGAQAAASQATQTVPIRPVVAASKRNQ